MKERGKDEGEQPPRPSEPFKRGFAWDPKSWGKNEEITCEGGCPKVWCVNHTVSATGGKRYKRFQLTGGHPMYGERGIMIQQDLTIWRTEKV